MEIELDLKEYEFPGIKIKLYTPKEEEIKVRYLSALSKSTNTHFPYWAKLWPAAVGLCTYMLNHPELLANKNVLELAAGLGLPSLVASANARSVCCSDYNTDVLTVVEKSIGINGFDNVHTQLLDWNHLPEDLNPEVLLLSDVNYDPEHFFKLKEMLYGFLEKKATILLSTPQRLMAKPFIEWLLFYCIQKEEIEIINKDINTRVSIFVLQKVN